MIFKEEIALRPRGSRQGRSQEGLDLGTRRVMRRRFDLPTHNASRAEPQSQRLKVTASNLAFDWIEQIKQACSRGGIQTMELDRLVSTTGERMHYGKRAGRGHVTPAALFNLSRQELADFCQSWVGV
jgi:hypothetical protein